MLVAARQGSRQSKPHASTRAVWLTTLAAMKRKRNSPAMRAGILLRPFYRSNSRQLKGPHYHQYHDENHQQSGDFIHDAVKAGAVRVPVKKTVPTR